MMQFKILQFLLKNGAYTGSYRDFAKTLTGNPDDGSNIRRCVQSLVKAGVVSAESNDSYQFEKGKTIIMVREDWLN